MYINGTWQSLYLFIWEGCAYNIYAMLNSISYFLQPINVYDYTFGKHNTLYQCTPGSVTKLRTLLIYLTTYGMIIAVQSKNSPGCQNVIARFCSAPCTITQFWPTSCSVTSRNITNVHYTCHTNHSVPSNDAGGELHLTTTYTLKFLPFKLCANAMWKK